jgi:hypothetical protein
MNPYMKLAHAVLAQAAKDFATPRLMSSGNKRLTPAQQAQAKLALQIEAGEFLLDREDAVVHHWCVLAGRGARANVSGLRAQLGQLRVEAERGREEN